MLLETLDVKNKDILIYSENKFDFENNFKIVDKKSASKKPFKINFNVVGEYINSPSPKNMILYRLLTNIPDFKAKLSKYGVLIQINNLPEVVYYDPVFAVAELERLSEMIDFHSFRFKIQQIGLVSSNMQNAYQNYKELYNFDLKAEEAKNQNDRVFAEAIFAFDPDFIENSDNPKPSDESDMQSEKVQSFVPLEMVLSEDHKTAVREFQKLNALPDIPVNNVKENDEEKINFREFFSSGKTKSNPEGSTNQIETSMGEFLRKQKLRPSVDSVQNSSDNLLALFKTTSTYVNDRTRQPVILKLNNK